MNEYKYDDIVVGMKESYSFEIDEDMMNQFLLITGDTNPLHCDEKYARSKGFPSKVVYGMLTASFFSTLAGVYLPGKYSLIHSVETKYVNPVLVGDKLTIEGMVSNKNDMFQVIELKVAIKNQKNKKVCRGLMKVGVINE